MSLAIITLAAGKSSRMKSSVSKVLHKLCHKPIINYVVDSARLLSPKQIILVLSSENIESVKASVRDVECVVQQKQLGTGDAVKSAMPILQPGTDKVLILYGDTPLVKHTTMQKMVDGLDDFDVVILGFFAPGAKDYARIMADDKCNVSEIIEAADASEEQMQNPLCNSGVISVKATSLAILLEKVTSNNAKGEYYLTDIVKIAVNLGLKCRYVAATEDEVLGINSRQQLAFAEHKIQEQLRDKMMASGVTLIAPETIFLAADTKMESDVTIHPNVVIGPGVSIAKNSVIHSFSHLEGCDIKEGVSVGPFARIRPGTILAEESRVGNFVEIKNSTVGHKAKINHLSYIGDAKIGDRTNIGAGTITCNYDGVSKHHTVIGDDVFIGSNTALVAPIQIDSGALVGAGSTITKDVRADELAIARGEQKNISGGASRLRAKQNKSFNSKKVPTYNDKHYDKLANALRENLRRRKQQS
jgi:bifunctional UDP-N-acetylglucosamine pyrophosphorylase/glucosamine-1-phosphate N-acetyltransferase